MSLLNLMRADLLNVRKNRDETRIGVLTAQVDAVAMVGKNKGNRETTDEEAVNVVKKFLDTARENEALLAARGDSDALAKTRVEIEVLECYMPSQMTEEELVSVIKEFIQTNPGSKIGDVMAYLKTSFSGRYDGKLASAITKFHLMFGP